MRKLVVIFILSLLPLLNEAQTMILSFHGETLAEALRQIDRAQHSRHILFVFDEMELYTVTADVNASSPMEAVQMVCGNFPVSIVEKGNNIFVEYIPKTVNLETIVVNGEQQAAEQQTYSSEVDPDYVNLCKFAGHINYFNQLCPQEKVYLHLDNTAYFEGETIWYSAYVVGDSKVLYVELLSPTGVILKQQKLKVVDGRCHGSFPLIDADVKAAVDLRGALPYPSGYYQLRAYTHAMLNFDVACLYSRVIPVYEAPEVEGQYDNPVINEYEGAERERPQMKRSERPDELNVTFYPEGGHLMADIPCRIAFKATDGHGLGCDVDSVLNADGVRIPLRVTHLGMGAFDYVSKKGNDKLTFYIGGDTYAFHLPSAESVGCALHHTADNDTLRFKIQLCGFPKAEKLGYTLTSGGKIWAFDSLTVASGVAGNQPVNLRISIPQEELPTGVAQFTLFNTKGAVMTQRLLFVDNGVPTVPVHVEAENDNLAPFDSVSLHLQTANQQPCTFSVAVRDPMDYGTSYSDDVRTYMLLSSELKGLIEEPEWYFGNHSSTPSQERGRKEALDLLMMVQGWTRYDWAMQALPNQIPQPMYPREEQLVLDGWAFSRILERPLADVKMTAKLYSPDGKQVQKASVQTDSLGYWSIGLQDFEGVGELYLFTKQRSKLGEKLTTRVRFGRSIFPPLQPYRPEDIFLPEWDGEYPTIFGWQEKKDKEPLVQFFPDWKGDIAGSYELDEVEIMGKRRYIDYNRFRAFDAFKDTEMDIDEGDYTHDVVSYLEFEKGYHMQFIDDSDQYGVNTPSTDINVLRRRFFRNYRRGSRFYYGIDYEDGYKYTAVTDPLRHRFVTVEVEGHDTFWNVVNPWVHTWESHLGWGNPNGNRPWDIPMEDVKSVLVFNYEPGHRYVEVRIELLSKEERKQRQKNYRSTNFAGYSTPVEFYAPTYPNGPVKGDKDYRRTVYWNPEVTTDPTGAATIGFYNNGYSRTLTISAEGLTADGVPILNE